MESCLLSAPSGLLRSGGFGWRAERGAVKLRADPLRELQGRLPTEPPRRSQGPRVACGAKRSTSTSATPWR